MTIAINKPIRFPGTINKYPGVFFSFVEFSFFPSTKNWIDLLCTTPCGSKKYTVIKYNKQLNNYPFLIELPSTVARESWQGIVEYHNTKHI